MVTMSTSTSTQIPNQKASKNGKKKKHISREQHNKQANISQGKLWKVTPKLTDPVFITSAIYPFQVM